MRATRLAVAALVLAALSTFGATSAQAAAPNTSTTASGWTWAASGWTW